MFLKKKKVVVDGNLEQPTLRINDLAHLEEELAKDAASTPFTSHLTPHELYLLRQNGYEPVQVVVGVIVFSMGVRGVVRSVFRAFQRGEMMDFSHFNQIAREVALKRMAEEARKIAADGVVGTRLDITEYADFIEAVASGTAVRKVSEPVINREVVVGV